MNLRILIRAIIECLMAPLLFCAGIAGIIFLIVKLPAWAIITLVVTILLGGAIALRYHEIRIMEDLK